MGERVEGLAKDGAGHSKGWRSKVEGWGRGRSGQRVGRVEGWGRGIEWRSGAEG